MTESDIVTKVKNERLAKGKSYKDYFTPMQWEALKRGAGFSRVLGYKSKQRNKRTAI